mmetsp:Transcript_17025/g.53295  ORF Transcript_17025/g.53295 Transcript_17025/m.53295 type:complete len:374 (-) Transcript_17025:275-1396(-)
MSAAVVPYCKTSGPAPSAAPAVPKRRGPTAKSLVATTEVISSEVKQEDFNAQLAELVQCIKNEPELLAICRGVVKKRSKHVHQVEHLPKGIRYLGAVSDKVARLTLAALSGAPLDVFVNLPPQDNNALLVWSCGGNPQYKLPELEMAIAEFHQWCKAAYESAGEVLKDLDWDHPAVTLDWTLGVYGFCSKKPFAELANGDEIQFIKQHCTGVMFELPLGFRPKFHEIGSIWTIQKNFNAESALIVSSELQAQLLISKLAPNQQAPVAACKRGMRQKRMPAVKPDIEPVTKKANTASEDQDAGEAGNGKDLEKHDERKLEIQLPAGKETAASAACGGSSASEAATELLNAMGEKAGGSWKPTVLGVQLPPEPVL